MSRRNSTEIVHEGWLTKSPPTKRIWRARWRKRWFVLRQTGDLPGQYFLEYYTDRQCLKLKGRVDLDQCEQVDSGIQFENRKLKYLKHLFDLKTPKRTYYLSADSEADMNKWVDCVCKVCGLKADSHEDEYYSMGPPLEESTVSTVTANSSCVEEVDLDTEVEPSSPAPSSSSSTPYILMSECYSGRLPPALAKRQAQNSSKYSAADTAEQQDEFYDAPRKLQPVSPPQSPGTDSVFSEQDWGGGGPNVNWSTFPRDSVDGSELDATTWSAVRRFSKACTIQDPMEPPEAPPRPPKPSHLAEPSSGYLNLQPSPTLPDDMYDFPRSHQVSQNAAGAAGNCYTNAAPGQSGVVFRYDFASPAAAVAAASAGLDEDHTAEPPSTPKSETGSQGVVYSNLPSPALVLPPCVNRELKPGRRLSDSTSNEPSPGGPLSSPAAAPNVDRKLKPRTKNLQPESPRNLDPCSLPLMSAPSKPDIGGGTKRRQRAAPSPTPPGQGMITTTPIIGQVMRDGYSSCSDDETRFRDSGDEEANFYYVKEGSGMPRFERARLDKVKYLDLDHEMGLTKSSKSGLPERSTIYNTVDFVKTKAFNQTRQEIESHRQTSTSSSSSTAVPS